MAYTRSPNQKKNRTKDSAPNAKGRAKGRPQLRDGTERKREESKSDDRDSGSERKKSSHGFRKKTNAGKINNSKTNQRQFGRPDGENNVGHDKHGVASRKKPSAKPRTRRESFATACLFVSLSTNTLRCTQTHDVCVSCLF